MTTIYIYRIQNIVNGKNYVGQSVNPNYRLKQHEKDGQSLISKAIKKHGINNFVLHILQETDTKTSANILETFWINAFNCVTPKGYNVRSIAETNRGAKLNFSFESKMMSDIGLEIGRTMPRTEKQLAALRTGHKHIKNHNCPKRLKAVSKASKGNQNTACHYKITNKLTGKVDNIFNLKKYCRENGLSYSSMTKYSQGSVKSHIWKVEKLT